MFDTFRQLFLQNVSELCRELVAYYMYRVQIFYLGAQFTTHIIKHIAIIIPVLFVTFFTQILSLAKRITGKQETKAAVKEFKTNITSQDMYFNKDPLPANETGEQAFKLCNSVTGAMRFCPKRWETLQKWFKASREVIYAWANLLFCLLFLFLWQNTKLLSLLTIQCLSHNWHYNTLRSSWS